MNERRIHQAFEIGVILKGLDALVECVGGLLLFVTSTQWLVRWTELLTHEELTEDRHDLVANALLKAAHHLSVGTEHFYALYLLSHGLIKIAVVVGLLKEVLWAYPASLAVIAGFVAYQLYRYTYTHSAFLIALTVFDLVVMGLVWHEWRILKHHFETRD
ncbi:MAG: DUF2127 domain-containing protein [Sphingomonadales bacterium]|nr:DUF2127 domain-containing protein [Sphingomonadales bacterium]MDE2568384.1 DUF2127 domain-containing protein [Sphingomonadales bacterium]